MDAPPWCHVILGGHIGEGLIIQIACGESEDKIIGVLTTPLVA